MSMNLSILAGGQRASPQDSMQFVDREEGGYRIHAEATGGELGDGYVAKVVISRIGGTGVPQEAFRDDALAGGYRWPTAAAALCFAIGKGRTRIDAMRACSASRS
jgi:hypothetical protein